MWSLKARRDEPKIIAEVRSASRLGYLDLGVNARRLNKISSKLRDLGWQAPKITGEDFPRWGMALRSRVSSLRYVNENR